MDFKTSGKNFYNKVSLDKLISSLRLLILWLPKEAKEIFITNKEVNRPGLNLINFFDGFDASQIQLFGSTEYNFLFKLRVEDRQKSLDVFFDHRPSLVILTKCNGMLKEFLEVAKKYGVALLKTEMELSDFLPELVSFINLEMAPSIVIPGGLMEVYGEGVIVFGESGIGKSETAVELIKRGHRLVADDVVRITKILHNTLVGTSPENIRHFLEIRGVGIINVRQLFGFGAVKIKKTIDLLIKLEKWDDQKQYDRVGNNKRYTEILNVKIPTITLPVKAGRTIAVIIEAAAMNHRQNKMGYSAPEQLLKKLGYKEDFNDQLIEDGLDIDKIF